MSYLDQKKYIVSGLYMKYVIISVKVNSDEFRGWELVNEEAATPTYSIFSCKGYNEMRKNLITEELFLFVFWEKNPLDFKPEMLRHKKRTKPARSK